MQTHKVNALHISKAFTRYIKKNKVKRGKREQICLTEDVKGLKRLKRRNGKSKKIAPYVTDVLFHCFIFSSFSFIRKRGFFCHHDSHHEFSLNFGQQSNFFFIFLVFVVT